MGNLFRTGVLIAAMTALFMAVGYFIGGTGGMVMAFGFAVVTNFIGYWNSDKMVLRMQGAQAVDERRAPDLYRMVETLSANAGIPTPKVYIINTEQPNAFATGRNPQNGAVAVSAGLLKHLDQREVAAVIAHELAHIKNRDTLIMTITGTFAGAISMLAQFGLFFGGGNNRENPLGLIGTLLMVFLAPVAAVVVQMAVSRTREYEADKEGAIIARDPLALASALEKINALARRTVNVAAERNPAMAHLYIANPLSGARMDNLFSTHPDVRNRVAQLQKLAAEIGGGGARAAAPRASAQPTTPFGQPVERRPADRSSGASSAGGWRVPSTRGDRDDGPGPWG